MSGNCQGFLDGSEREGVMERLRCYACTVVGMPWERTIFAVSAGRAKYEYWRDLQDCWPQIPFTALRARITGSPRDEGHLREVCDYYGIPEIRPGGAVEVDGDKAWIAGSSMSGCHILGYFLEGESKGQTLPFHPTWRTRYLAADGSVIADFREEGLNGGSK